MNTNNSIRPSSPSPSPSLSLSPSPRRSVISVSNRPGENLRTFTPFVAPSAEVSVAIGTTGVILGLEGTMGLEARLSNYNSSSSLSVSLSNTARLGSGNAEISAIVRTGVLINRSRADPQAVIPILPAQAHPLQSQLPQYSVFSELNLRYLNVQQTDLHCPDGTTGFHGGVYYYWDAGDNARTQRRCLIAGTVLAAGQSLGAVAGAAIGANVLSSGPIAALGAAVGLGLATAALNFTPGLRPSRTSEPSEARLNFVDTRMQQPLSSGVFLETNILAGGGAGLEVEEVDLALLTEAETKADRAEAKKSSSTLRHRKREK